VLHRVHKADDDSYVVKVFNFPAGASEQEVKQLCQAAGASQQSVQVVQPVRPTLSLRFNDEASMKKAAALIQRLDANIVVEEQPHGRWHGVWFKNLTDEAEVKKALEPFAPAGFVTMKTLSGDRTGNAVAYFNDMSSAIRAVNALCDRAFGSKKLQANYKPHVLPAIHVRNLSNDVTVHDLEALFRTYHPLSIELDDKTSEDGASRGATIVLRAKRDEAHAIKTKHGAKLGDKRIKVESATKFSPMLVVKELANGSEQAQRILSQLKSNGVQVVASEVRSDEEVVVTFPTTWQARKAMLALRHGEIAPVQGTDSATLEVSQVKLDAPTLQVFGLSGETSVEQFISDLKSKAAVSLPLGLTTSRAAFVKFENSKETKAAIHDLKQIVLECQVFNSN
jgi:hypothetical protein